MKPLLRILSSIPAPEDEPISLRELQTQIMEDHNVSLDTVKRDYRKIPATYLEKSKRGRAHYVRLTEAGVQGIHDLLNAPEDDGSPVPLPCVLTSRISRTQWGQMMREVNTQGLRTAFVPQGVDVIIRYPDGREVTLESV